MPVNRKPRSRSPAPNAGNARPRPKARPATVSSKSAQRGALSNQKTGQLNAPIHRVIANIAPFGVLYDASQMDRIHMIKEGVPSSFVMTLANALNMSKERLYRTVGVSRATVDRKVKAGKALDKSESESVLAMGRLIGQVEEMVRTSGEPTGFNPAHWVAAWLEQPLPALGGQMPGDFMDTDEGRALVSALVSQMQSGAYA